jgi:hypothetical protein
LSPQETGSPQQGRPGAQAGKEARTQGKEDTSSRIVLLTIVGCSIAAAAGQWWLSPFLAVAPFIHLQATRSRVTAERFDGLTIRWAATVLLTTLIATAFLPDQTRASVFGGAGMDEQVRAWLKGSDDPGWGLLWLAVVPVVGALATIVSDGVAGWLLYGVLAAQLAIHASVIYERGTNLVLSTIVALSPWQWALMAGLTLLIGPLRERSFVHFLGTAPAYDPEKARRRLMIAGALFVLAVLLRLAFAGLYSKLTSHWTVA